MTEHAVIIAGGGPTGLMLAGELALAGIDAAIVERRASQELSGSRAGGLHARTIEIFDQRGIANRFLSQGQAIQVAGFAGVSLDISDFPTRHNYGLALWQNHIERILAGWVEELAAPIYRGRALIGLEQGDLGVRIALSDGTSLQARYLVGCDGGRSVVRRSAGIAFPGSEPTVSNLIAEARLRDEPPWGIRRDTIGIHGLSKIADGAVRILVTEQGLNANGDPTLNELSLALLAVYGSDFGVHSPTSLSRFTDTARQAASYRQGRVLLAGEAAHVHPPDGGQGLQIGIQDAVNLGWKLAQVVMGTVPVSLLDTYHAERHPVAARAIRHTMASVALRREDDRTRALRETMAELLGVEGARKAFAGTMSGLDIRYDLGKGHELLGRRIPDLDLYTATGPCRLFSLLHDARPLLITFDGRAALDIAGWADRVRSIEATFDGSWEVPVLGPVTAPKAVLIRPDGHVAWVGDRNQAGLSDALTIWFGPPK